MKTWAKRGLAAVLAAGLLGAGSWGYLYSKLPDTFLVPQGQGLVLAQLPWLKPQAAQGVQSVALAQTGSSYNVTLSAFGWLPIKQVRAVVVEQRAVTVCGTPFGIKMFSQGAMVVGFTDVQQLAGSANPAKRAGLRMGDRILAMDGVTTSSNEEVAQVIQNSQGRSVTVQYSRDGQTMETQLEPVQDAETGRWLAGMWVRDSSAGIGTLTFVENSTGIYGGLGHAISDADTGESIALRSGEIASVTITGAVKGAAGSPGELQGRFLTGLALGDILSNGSSGVYGHYYGAAPGKDYLAAAAQQVHQGSAQILVTVEGTQPKLYDAVIERVSLTEDDPNRNMVIRVTDPELLEKTGGIVQGMSGSPVIQDGQWVGAVTHVLVNDPTRGYGIFAENMLNAADQAEQGSKSQS